MRIVLYDDQDNVICAHYIELNTLRDEEFINNLADEADEHYANQDTENFTGFSDGQDRW